MENYVVYETKNGNYNKVTRNEWENLKKKDNSLSLVFEGNEDRCDACMESLTTTEVG